MKNKFYIIKIALIAATLIFCAFLLISCGEEKKPPETQTNAVSDETEDTVETQSAVMRTEDITDESGKVVGERAFGDGDVLLSEQRYDYAGRTSEYTVFNSDGKPSTVSKYIFTSASSDVPDSFTVERFEYKNGVQTGRTVETRIGEGSLTESIYVYGENDELTEAFRYEYNDSGLVSKETYVNSKNIITYIIEYEYEGGKVSKETYRNGAGTLTSYTEYTYSESGRILRESSFDADGNMTSYIDYVYDENDVFVETEEYEPDDDGKFVKID